MEKRLSLDFETRSRADLKKVGGYKYAEDPSTSVLVLAVKEGTLSEGGPVMSWSTTGDDFSAVELLKKAIIDKWEIHAFNSQFEWAILKHVCTRQLKTRCPDINRMRCTSALCRSAGLPPTLEKCAEFLRLPIQKDKMGRALIQKFSVPQKGGGFIDPEDEETVFTAGGQRMTAAEAFQRFVAYCENDVLTELAVADAMAPFALKGFPLDWFLADARMNDRGVPVHQEALEHARRLYEQHEVNLTSRFKEITDLTPAQNKKVLTWMQDRGYKASSLNKQSREAFGEDVSLAPEAKEAMRIKAQLSFAAVKKIPAMSNMAMVDGFIRGAFKFCGAQKTWRWTSEKVQFTNMKKPGKKLRPIIEEVFQDIAAGIDLETFQVFYGDPYEIIASLARYFVRFKDKMIYDLDYSSVEAKILPMLIGCRRILDRFDSGEDLYTTTAQALTKTLREKYNVEFSIDRDQGKTIVLATQFGGGWKAVFTATGEKWERSWCETAVAVVRKENPEFPEAWRAFQDAFVEALDRPGEWISASPHVKLGFTKTKPFPRMVMRLPSKRKIVLPLPQKKPITMVKVVTKIPTSNPDKPKKTSRWERVAGHSMDLDYLARRLDLRDPFIAPDAYAETCFTTWEISYYGHVEGVHYGRVHTYGGDLLQSATQATGADLLALGILEAERREFEPFLCVHDQCLAAADGDKDNFTSALCVVPEWFEGFPLSAETDVVRSYCKN